MVHFHGETLGHSEVRPECRADRAGPARSAITCKSATTRRSSRPSPGIASTRPNGHPPQDAQACAHIQDRGAVCATTPSLPRQRPAQAGAVTTQVRRVAVVSETIAPGMPRGLPSGHTVPRHTVRRPPNRQRDNALRGDAHPCQNSCAIAIMARAAAPGVRSDGAARENCHSRSASSTVSVATSSCPWPRATRGSSATPRPFRT